MNRGKGSGSRKEEGMSRRTMALILLGLAALAVLLVFLLLAGCTALAPVAPPAATRPEVPSFMEHVAGQDRGLVLLVGRSTCTWCLETKKLLANLKVDYYWIDLNTLDEANTTVVMEAVKVCGQVNSVPILVINNRAPCIIGFQEAQIRSVLG